MKGRIIVFLLLAIAVGGFMVLDGALLIYKDEKAKGFIMLGAALLIITVGSLLNVGITSGIGESRMTTEVDIAVVKEILATDKDELDAENIVKLEEIWQRVNREYKESTTPLERVLRAFPFASVEDTHALSDELSGGSTPLPPSLSNDTFEIHSLTGPKVYISWRIDKP